jgi:putative ABC transport system permease protein
MRTILTDARHGFRTLYKAPGFTLAAVLTIALGISANTAIFSVINSLLIRPLGFGDETNLVLLKKFSFSGTNVTYSPTRGRPGIAAPDELLGLSNQVRSFEEFGGYLQATEGANLAGGPGPRRISATEVTTNFFHLLKVTPVLGRSFIPDESKAGSARVCHYQQSTLEEPVRC